MMLEKTLDLFERLVVSQEKIAQALAGMSLTDAVEANAWSNAAAPEKPPEEPDRDRLKQKLDELKVPYTSKMATSTLVKKYEAALAKQQKAQKAAASEQKKEAPTNASVTSEQAKQRLIRFIEEFDHDTARDILKEHFQVDYFTGVKPVDYPKLVAALDNYTPNNA